MLIRNWIDTVQLTDTFPLWYELILPTVQIKCHIFPIVAERIVLDEPMFQGVNLKKNNWSREELYDHSVKRGIKMGELARSHAWSAVERGIADEFVYFYMGTK